MKSIHLIDKFSIFDDLWSPKILAEVNNQYVKIAKVKGEFVWHEHKDEDELFFVVKGKLFIDIKDGPGAELNEGEMIVIPRKTQHKPYTQEGEETWIMLFEPKSTKHTGDAKHPLTDNKERFI